jgi:transcriptional regulator with XRE-family HTH domain
MDILELGQAFRAARIEHRLTQQEVAKQAGVSVPTVSRFERGDLLEMGVVKLLTLFNLVGLELYPRPLGQSRTLDDIQRERIAQATPLGLRAAIQSGFENALTQGANTPSIGLRAGQQKLIAQSNQQLAQRVRHPKVKKNA